MTDTPLQPINQADATIEPTQKKLKQNSFDIGTLFQSNIFRASILLSILIILAVIAYLLWQVNQRQNQADYVISGEDLFNTGMIDKIVDEGKPQKVGMATPPGRSSTSQPEPIAKGEQTYFIRTSGDGPKLTRLVINEFDPPVGTTQAAKVDVQSKEPVQRVTIKLQTDTKTEVIQLKLADGDPTQGTWLGEWPVADTHNKIYTLTIEAESEKLPTSTITLSFR